MGGAERWRVILSQWDYRRRAHLQPGTEQAEIEADMNTPVGRPVADTDADRNTYGHTDRNSYT